MVRKRGERKISGRKVERTHKQLRRKEGKKKNISYIYLSFFFIFKQAAHPWTVDHRSASGEN